LSDEPLEWLPPLICLADYGGDWNAYLEAIYREYVRDFHCRLPRFDGRRVGLKRMPESAGKCCTFWHFISEGNVEADRLPDMRRCERIRWPRPLLDEAVGPGVRVRVWSNRRGKEARWVIALSDFSYVLILADRGEFLLPWTAYHVEFRNRRDQLRREYEAWLRVQERLKPPSQGERGLVAPPTHGR